MIGQTFECPAIYDWIQACLSTRTVIPFLTLPHFVASRSESSRKNAQDFNQWNRLTPRTLLFERFFGTMKPSWSAVQLVEALSSAGADSLLLQTLPEAILVPLQEAVIQSQTEPPPNWSKELLALVSREDVTMLLKPGQRPSHMQSTLLVSIYVRGMISLHADHFRHPHMNQTLMFTPFATLRETLKPQDHSMDPLKWNGNPSHGPFLRMTEG